MRTLAGIAIGLTAHAADKCGACNRFSDNLVRRDAVSDVFLCDWCWYGD